MTEKEKKSLDRLVKILDKKPEPKLTSKEWDTVDKISKIMRENDKKK